MASENETIADIVRELRDEPLSENGAKPWLHYLADRIEAAHKREIEYRAIIAGVSLADAVDEAHKREVAKLRGERTRIFKDNKSLAADNTRLRSEVAELRECLKEATNHICANCGKDYERKCNNCIVKNKWRKALKGACDD